jgi:hypothetical protein
MIAWESNLDDLLTAGYVKFTWNNIAEKLYNCLRG